MTRVFRHPPQLGELVFVGACASLIVAVAAVQLTQVAGLDPARLTPPMFVAPALVGSFFGSLLVLVWRLRSDLSLRHRELRRERVRSEELLAQVRQLAQERGAMVEQAHDALAHAERAAMAGHIAGKTAHDLNNLMAVVLSGLELASEDALEPDDLSSMRLATERSIVLIDRLLHLVRQPSPHAPAAVPVHRVVEQLAPVLRGILGDVPLHTELGAAEGWVDPFDLELSILNLVGNARDATTHAGRHTPVQLRTGSDDDAVWIEVIDRGRGMDPDELAHAPTALFSTKGDHGTGLGLAIVRDAMDACGGTLDLVSAKGEGTTARLELRPARAVTTSG